jgi:cellulose synthase/poly-beta-1,6-N-acetylglucosamine synthase-like glycosyltransferase
MHAHDRLLVVADNCTDDTASIARSLGAIVLERHDRDLIGKGYALDWAMAYLRQQGEFASPGVVVFIDADCWLLPKALDSLVSTAYDRNIPIQSTYLLKGVDGASSKTRLREFAFAIRNLARPLGGRAFGVPCPLMGSGMAFPWHIISKMKLASSHLVEDRKLGVDCAAAGYPPRLLTSATVLSEFPENAIGQATQTARWERGAFLIMRELCGPLLAATFKNGGPRAALLALDLMIPPLGLLAAVNGALFVAAVAMLLASSGGWWLLFPLLPLPLLIAGMFFTFLHYGRTVVGFAEIWSIFEIIISKFRNISVLTARSPEKWIRSERDTKDQDR